MAVYARIYFQYNKIEPVKQENMCITSIEKWVNKKRTFCFRNCFCLKSGSLRFKKQIKYDIGWIINFNFKSIGQGLVKKDKNRRGIKYLLPNMLWVCKKCICLQQLAMQ